MKPLLHTYLLRLRPGQIVHRTGNVPSVWEKAVALAKLMPHLDVNGNRIIRKPVLPELKLIISTKDAEIILPPPGRYTLRNIWLHQPEPRGQFMSFASSFGLFAQRNLHLVEKKKSNGYTTWVILQ